MQQRTCNIIMCCKGHCKLDGATGDPFDDILSYMSKECGCPSEDYKGKLLESILLESMFDYINFSENPGSDLRNLFYQYATMDPSLSERIVSMFRLVKVKRGFTYINGFNTTLISQSEKDIGGKQDG